MADARAHLPAIEQLAELASLPDWVTEDPEAHLLDRLRAGSERAGMTITSVAVDPDGALTIHLETSGKKSRRELREQVWALVGGVAELSTHVRETKTDAGISFDVVTGIPPGDGRFATHGHTLRVHVREAHS